jgi:hypothetical protein
MSASAPYLDLAGFTARTVMPASDITVVETKTPGKTAALIAQHQAWIDSRLRKRYAVPFNQNGATVPEVVLMWLVRLVTPDEFRARGVTPGQDDQVARIDALADEARADIREAADSKEGLFDLPLSDALTPSAIVQPQILSHSPASPYEWMDRQRRRGRREDERQ